ncbi:MAG: MBL fold metallo-hydrolase [Nitrospiraceae bacterium]
MPLEDDFCDIVKKARMGQGLSVADVALKAGLPPGEVTVLERAGRVPARSEVEALASALHLRTEPLIQIALEGWGPAPSPAPLSCVETVLGDIGGYAVKGYVLHDAGEALLIDTAYNADRMLEIVAQRGLRLLGVCLTHGHADHAGGLDVILQHWRVPVYLGEADKSLLGWRPPRDLMAQPDDGRAIAVGRLKIQCMTTPGHTPGGICYRLDQEGRGLCFVGDTLFAGSIGRANPFSLYPVHLESVRRRVLALPEQTVLLPGHGPATTVAEERRHNPFGADA